MTWSLKSLPGMPSSISGFILVVGATSILLIISMTNVFYPSGELAYHMQAYNRPTGARRTMALPLNWSRISNASVRAARESYNCKDLKAEELRGWTKLPVSIHKLKQQAFLPNYKNPCWWADTTNTSIRCLPYFYLAGFPKCGTTDLYFRLIQHPLIVAAKYKEPHFITRFMYRSSCLKNTGDPNCLIRSYSNTFYHDSALQIQNNNKYSETAKKKWQPALEDQFRDEWYRLLQAESKNKAHPMITVDGSASTAWDNSRWRRIEENRGCSEPAVSQIQLLAKLNPKVKVVMILREPADRLYSDYLYFSTGMDVSPDDFHKKVVESITVFTACIQERPIRVCWYEETPLRLHVGIYYIPVSDWLSVLPRDQVHLIASESYREDVIGVLRDLFTFLDLPPLSEEAMEAIASLKEKNTSKKQSRVGKMLPETLQLLRTFYSGYNEKLAKLLQDERFKWEGHSNKSE